MRFGLLEQEMQKTNEEYQAAVERASTSNLTLRLDPFYLFTSIRKAAQGDHRRLPRIDKRREQRLLNRRRFFILVYS
jgi:hypothetical protein